MNRFFQNQNLFKKNYVKIPKKMEKKFWKKF